MGLFASAAVLAGCSTVKSPPDTVNPTVSTTIVRPTAGSVAWRLPKTVIDATVTFKYVDCKDPVVAGGRPTLELERTVALVARGVADDNIFGPNEPFDPFVRVPVSALTSFWQDRTLTVNRAPNGTLAQLSAVAEDQTAAIAGNLFTTATKLGSIAFGVAPGGAQASTATCSATPKATKATYDRLKAQLRDPNTTPAQAAAYVLQLADAQEKLDRLTITVTRTIDPGVTAIDATTPVNGVPRNGEIAGLEPSIEQLKKAGWLSGSDPDQFDAMKDVRISVFLDFEKATPAIIQKCDPATPCRRHPTVISRSTQFREPAYIPLIVVAGRDPTNTVNRFALTINGAKPAGPIPFAQFGIPRALPIKAGLFERVAWTYNFNEFGEQTNVSFGSSAQGVKATSALAGAAGAAATLANQERTDDAKADPETVRLQAEAARLKAEADIMTHKKTIDGLRKEGWTPD